MPAQPTGSSLVHQTKEAYQGTFTPDLLEQYKLYVQTAENVSARRVASSRYCLTLNTALVALHGFQNELQHEGIDQIFLALLIPVIGIAASYLWLRIIESHRQLNSIKFNLIHQLEDHLPAALFKHEWEIAGHGQGSKYSPVTKIERWIPRGFIIIHFVLLIVTVFVSNILPLDLSN